MEQFKFVLIEPDGTKNDGAELREINGKLTYYHNQVGSHTDTFIRINGCPMTVTAGALAEAEAKGVDYAIVRGTGDIAWAYGISFEKMKQYPPKSFGRELQYAPPAEAWDRLELKDLHFGPFDKNKATPIELRMPLGATKKVKNLLYERV